MYQWLMRIHKIFLLFLLVSCFVPTIQAEKSGLSRPNFVFFLVDDLGKMDMSCEGSQFYETPHIDSIASHSARFEHGYSTCQVCSPSRASIQTGKYPFRVGITDYISVSRGNQPEKWGRNTKLLPAEYKPQLALSELTVAEALKPHGYATFFAGKWHLGSKGFSPLEQGYDVNVGGHHAGTPPGGYFAPHKNPAMSDGPVGEELPLRLAADTAKFIRNHQQKKDGQPFFAMLSFYSVHGPIQTSEQRWKKYQEKAEKLNLTSRTAPRFKLDRTKEVRQVQDHPVYAGMMESLDESIGLVLQTIKEQGLEDNTVIIFTSDNGGVSSGDGFATSCLPMRGGKGRQWEGGIRQPFYIQVPGLTHGQKISTPVTGSDFFPTILDLANLAQLPDHHVDGVSLLPLMHGNSIPQRSLFWHYPHYGNQGGEPSSIVRRGEWKLIKYHEDQSLELYNVKEDIEELTDLANNHPKLVASLEKELDSFLKSTKVDFPSENPKWNSQNYVESLDRLKNIGMPRREAQHADFLKPHFKPRSGWWQSSGR